MSFNKKMSIEKIFFSLFLTFIFVISFFIISILLNQNIYANVPVEPCRNGGKCSVSGVECPAKPACVCKRMSYNWIMCSVRE